MKRISTSMAVGIFAFITFVVLLFACSTEKNTFINRTYHSTTARYNGYFNAKEMIRIGLKDYRGSYREDFNEILPIELLPNEEDVTEFYPIVDTAISKCETVISKHSMPTASKPSQKKTEHANWIDQNWLLIGRANYIRRDYEKALKNFEYVRKFYEGRSSTYTGQLWEAKTQIKLGDLTEAGRTLQKLDQRVQVRLSEKKDSKSKSKILRNKNKDDEDKSPELPKDFQFEFAKTKAMLALAKKNYEKATKALKTALKEARQKEDKARISFIIGQLLQQQNKPEAREYYTQSIRKNAPFEMSFNARINRAVVSDLDDDEMIEELEDMAKEEKYLEFRDQIYYAMAQVELGRNQEDEAKVDLTQSVFYSLNNPRQKGISYEKLGDLSFEDKNYVFAQKYYDSSAQVIPETYKNAEAIRNKAEKLAELVENIDLIAFEDSVQRIANMDEKSRDKFLKDIIKQLQEEEQERKRREAEKAERMRELQQSYAAQNQGRGNKWYFSNPKAMQEGVEEFRRVWGQRENEDYWRLSNKPSHYVESFQNVSDSSAVQDSTIAETDGGEVSVENLTPEILLEDVPLSDSAMEKSNERLLEALYNSGMIYKEQLGEVEMGVNQFQRVLDKDVENEHNLLSAFQLYKVYEEKNSPKKSEYESYILNNYPNSDYANYLKDPDYFIKKKERDALAQKEYLKSVERFERGLYYPVILKAKKVIAEEPENIYRKEYFLLQAMAMGHINRDKSSLLPVLNQAIEEYPDTQVAKRAKELIDLINNGVPPFESFSEDRTGLFNRSESDDEFSVLIKLGKERSANEASKRVDNFNREFFSRARLETKSQMYNRDVTFITVGSFPNIEAAEEYIKDFEKTRKHLGDLRTSEVLFISKKNFKILLKENALEAYTGFYMDNY